ncbi:hypothetical protein F7725_007454, partial [Dissostichus mawsoni]
MGSVDDFLRAPSEEQLEVFTREQLVYVAEHFRLDVGDKRMKENMREIVRANLFEEGFFKGGILTVSPSRDSVSASGCRDAGLTFEQRERLLLLQVEIKKLELEERRERGHSKADCPKAKASRGNCVGQFNSAACAVSV